jgi:glycosyltransferase involved in cell wall biosynthesis/predicted O-methyltransferase YrrM
MRAGDTPIAAGSGPLVSCIMPTADRRHHVARSLACFRRQEHPWRELIIIDDGEEPVEDLLGDDPRIRYLRLDRRTPLGRKRNLAVAAARGAIIAHWDDDDWYGPERLSRQIAPMLRPGGASVAVCGLRALLYLSVTDGRAWRYAYPAGRRPPWVSGNTLCYRRRVWEEHPFAEIATGEDTRFVWATDPGAVLALGEAEEGWHLGIIHGRNASGVAPSGPWWRPADPAEARARLGAGAEEWLATAAATTPAARRTAMPRRAPVPAVTEPSPMPRSAAAGAAAGAGEDGLAVVVTCHAGYLPWLGTALDSIDRQDAPAAEKILVLDGCQAPARPGWQTVPVAFGDPSPARNAGLARTSSPWIIFWDADHAMQPGFLAAVRDAVAAAGPDLGILYPDLQPCDASLRPNGTLRRMPEWDYWRLRADNMVDTASAWRREALALAGPWPNYLHASNEDYALALDVTAAGWRAARLGGPALLMRDHADGRNRRSMADGAYLDDIWRARSLGIVTPLARRPRSLERWWRFLRHAELPPKTSLYVVDNAGDPAFSAWIHEACRDLQAARGIGRVEILDGGAPFAAAPDQPRDHEDRHRHVARLYGMVMPRVREDLVLTLEDDVEPPPDAVRRLGREFGWTGEGRRVGAVAAAYGWPGYDGMVCAGLGDDAWGEAPRWEALGDGPQPVGFVGGGCTIWANWAVGALPVRFQWSRRHLGWDGGYCAELRRRGWQVLLHGGVRCRHHHGDGTSAAAGLPRVWQPPAGMRLGEVIPPWRPVLPGRPVSEGHRRLAARGKPDGLFRGDVPGWLWMADALTLHELAHGGEGSVLELGCFQGLSTSILAGALAECGLRERRLLSVDIEPSATMLARRTVEAAGLGAWVEFRCVDAAAACRELVRDGKRFGLVFVDHSHAYDDVLAVSRTLAALVAPGGHVVFHDYNDGRNADPAEPDYDVVRAVADGLDAEVFNFVGILGCNALFRRR